MTDTEPDKAPAQDEDEPKLITFKTFLESAPPGHDRQVNDYYERKQTVWVLSKPRLSLHCSSAECSGERYFDPIGDKKWLEITQQNDVYLKYICSNCRKNFKYFSLWILGKGVHNPGILRKYGEVPSFGPPVPNRLLRLLEEDGDKALFLKGRQCENQGLGVGAFSYYRRVVENKKAALIKEIIKVADTVNAPQVTKDALHAALNENQFKTSVEMIKDAIPETLLINGHNPMTLLYSALSDGLHDRDDEHCLERATSIRLVLSDLVQKVADARKENTELQKALANLTAKPSKSE